MRLLTRSDPALRVDCAAVATDVPLIHSLAARRGASLAPMGALLRTHATGLVLPLFLLLCWEFVVAAGVTPKHLLPAPSEVAGTLVHLAVTGALVPHIGASVARVLAGFALGALAGVAAGITLGLNRATERAVDPLLQGLRAIPSLAWVPLLLLWLGIDEAPKITLIALGAFFPAYLNTLAAVAGVDRKWIELGRVHGLSRAALVRRIVMPASLPGVMTGLRGGLSLAWMFVVAAELIASTKGIGYLLSDGRETGRADLVLGAIVLLGVLGKMSDGVLKRIEARALAYRDTAA